MIYKHIFKPPKPMKITGRTSTITNSFVTSIIPSIEPTKEEIDKCLEILELDKDNLSCAYCGDKYTEWDHLRPLVKDKKPTGYISEIKNLVPACGKCNQSKGNKNWESWMRSGAPLSPKTREVKDVDKKIERLKEYERWGDISPLELKKMVDKELWNDHWRNHEKLHQQMSKCQEQADKIKVEIEEQLKEQRQQDIS